MAAPEIKLKGHPFTGPDDPMFKAPRGVPRAEAWKRHVERFKIVATCADCNKDLIAEERVAHRFNHVPAQIRGKARDVESLPREQRVAVLALFCPKCGALLGAEECSGH